MKGSEIRRLIETHDHEGVFDDESAARELKEKDVLNFESIRTLVILADTVRTLDAFEFIDDSSKCAMGMGVDVRVQQSVLQRPERIASVRPKVVIQLVRKLYSL